MKYIIDLIRTTRTTRVIGRRRKKNRKKEKEDEYEGEGDKNAI